MIETILKAMERTENPKKVRDAGFVPGVLNGPGTSSTSVKFETKELNKVISKHGRNAKIWVELGTEKLFGFIKDVQRDPVEGTIVHAVVHLVAKDQEVKMQLPISFRGLDQLEHKLMHVQIYKSEVEVLGHADQMPDVIVVDISEKENGASITAIDLHIPQALRILDTEHEIYAVIKSATKVITEAPKEVKPTK